MKQGRLRASVWTTCLHGILLVLGEQRKRQYGESVKMCIDLGSFGVEMTKRR